MSVNFNEDGGLEVSPGPRGFSVVGTELSEDGTTMYLLTDQPGKLNGVRLPVGPRGPVGDYGDPGEARIRIDETVGFRLFLWDTATAGENMVYGDTGTRQLGDGTLVRRVNNVVERTGTTTPAGLGAGFAPAVTGGTVGRTYVTADAWPETLPGTEAVAPQPHRGLEGYTAAATQGYPGTAEEWMNMVYRVVLPPAGTTNQVLTRTAEGSDWRDLPLIGPAAWQAITLENWSPVNGSGAFARLNNGTVELYGLLTYTGAQTTVGSFTYLRVGVLPPALAPAHGMDRPITTYRSSDNEATAARLVINTQGVISISALTFPGQGAASFTAKANVAQVNISDVSFALRNS